MVDSSLFRLALPSGGSGRPCLLGVWWLTLLLEVVFGPSFLWLGLAFPSPGGNWPFLLASEEEVRHSFLEWRVWPSE